MKEKYIYPFMTKHDGTHYFIAKTDPTIRKQVNYGSYKTIDEAILARDELVINDWDEALCPNVHVRRHNKDKQDKYIDYKHGAYYINKTFIVDGKKEVVTFDTGIRTLEEARELRDWWVEHDWNWDEI